jgi:hypothetical protein
MDNIPDEIFLEIAKHLPIEKRLKCACVSRRWRNIMTDEIFFKCLFLDTLPNILIEHNNFHKLYIEYLWLLENCSQSYNDIPSILRGSEQFRPLKN